MGKKSKKGKSPLEKELEVVLQNEINYLKDEGMKILQAGAKEAAKTAVKEIEILHKQYVTQYYGSYYKKQKNKDERLPKQYIRNNDPKHNLYSILIKSRVYDNGHATIWFGYENLEFFRHPQSDPGMVFDSFMSNSRRSSPVVEAKYPKYFGVGVVSFKPNAKGNVRRTGATGFDIMSGFAGGKLIYSEMLKKAPSTYIRKSGTYISEYFNDEWKIFLNSYLNK